MFTSSYIPTVVTATTPHRITDNHNHDNDDYHDDDDQDEDVATPGRSVEIHLELDNGTRVKAGVFVSHVQAGKAFAVSRGSIKRWCNNNEFRKGYWWSNSKQWFDLPVDQIDVKFGNVMESYDSALNASQALNICKEEIYECLCGRRESCGDGSYSWRYHDDLPHQEDKQADAGAASSNKQKNNDTSTKATNHMKNNRLCHQLSYRPKRPVEQICLETGNVIAEFESIRLAANTVGTFKSGIRACLTGRSKSSRGFFWRLKGSDKVPPTLGTKPKKLKSKPLASSEQQKVKKGRYSKHKKEQPQQLDHYSTKNQEREKVIVKPGLVVQDEEERKNNNSVTSRISSEKHYSAKQGSEYSFSSASTMSSPCEQNMGHREEELQSHNEERLISLLRLQEPKRPIAEEVISAAALTNVEDIFPATKKQRNSFNDTTNGKDANGSSYINEEQNNQFHYFDNKKYEMVGRRISLLRKKNKTWQVGTLRSYDRMRDKHLVRLDSGEKVRLCLEKVLFEWAD